MAKEVLYKSIGQALTDFGQSVVTIAKQMYLNLDKKASGKLINNLKYRLYYKKGNVELVWSSTKYQLYVDGEDGKKWARKPNSTPPPIAPISKWIRQKHIQFTDKNGNALTNNQMSYIISKAIGRKGIKAEHVMGKAMAVATSKMRRETGNFSFISNYIKNDIKKVINLK